MNIVMIGIQILWIAIMSVASGFGVALFVELIVEPLMARFEFDGHTKPPKVEWYDFTHNPMYNWCFLVQSVIYAILISIIWGAIIL